MSGPSVFVLHGPNPELLGLREPEIYGSATLDDVERLCRVEADRVGLDLIFRQSNAEHELIDWIREANGQAAGIIIDAGAFTHDSNAICDALKACHCPIVEVHISNIHARTERWRARSVISLAATGVICGLGVDGYRLAMRFVAEQVSNQAFAPAAA